MAGPVGGKRTVGSQGLTNLGSQAGSTFPIHDGDGVPDNKKNYGLVRAVASGPFGAPSVPLSDGTATDRAPTTDDGSTMKTPNYMALSGGRGADPDEPPSAMPDTTTRSGGSKRNSNDSGTKL